MPKFIAAIVIYSIVCFLIFGFAYMGVGMEKNFYVGQTKATNASHAFYHSWCVQSTSMDEIQPTTTKGRVIQAVQCAAAWLPMALLLAPWSITSGK